MQLCQYYLHEILCFVPTANERVVQATSKKVAVKQGLQNVKTSLLLTGKSIKRVPYKFRKAHYHTKFKRNPNQKKTEDLLFEDISIQYRPLQNPFL